MSHRRHHPTEGVTRCHCGVKYWDQNPTSGQWHCHGCGEKYDPKMDDERIQAEREDRAALRFLTNMIVGGNG